MKAGGTPKFKCKRVKIIWQDIVTDASWFDSLQDVDKLNVQWCEDIGYLFSKDTKTVKIFTSFNYDGCLLYTSPSPRDGLLSRMPSSA